MYGVLGAVDGAAPSEGYGAQCLRRCPSRREQRRDDVLSDRRVWIYPGYRVHSLLAAQRRDELHDGPGVDGFHSRHIHRSVEDRGRDRPGLCAGTNDGAVFHAVCAGDRGDLGGSLTALAFTYSLVARGTGLFMPVLTQVGKVADVAARSRKGILVCTGLALFVSLLCSVWGTLYLGYAHGAYNFNSWQLNSAAPKVLNDVVVYMQSPFPTDWEKLQFFWIGAGVMAVMTFLRYRFPGWPIHPIGFAISSTYFSYRMTFSIFLAWAFKWIFIKIGDAALYRRSRPFFIGILVGWALGVALTILVDTIWFPGSGHHIHAD